MYVTMYVCMYVRTYVCMYIYMLPPKDLPFLVFCSCQRGSICWEPFAKTK